MTVTDHVSKRSRSNRPAHRKDAPLTLSQETARGTPRVSRRRPVTPFAAEPPESFNDGPLAKAILAGLEDSKAEDIVKVDVTGKTSLADMMIIATGRSSVHVNAIADRIARACREAGYPSPRIEGQPLCDWVLLDLGDAIVHVFRSEVRQFYNLEKLWSADRPGEARVS